LRNKLRNSFSIKAPFHRANREFIGIIDICQN
jgi:hypothetical protein